MSLADVCIPKYYKFAVFSEYYMNIYNYIRRDEYLDKLIARCDNGEVIIITGP